MIVSLIGYRGCGKSSVGQHLAQQLAWPFADSDDEVEHVAGARIADIFVKQGEKAFRRMEAECITELLLRDRLVLSLGGGAVLREDTAEAIMASGPVVWLRSDAETLLQRVAADGKTAARRPSLTHLPARQELERLMQEREPIYTRCATWQVECGRQSPHEIAHHIAEQVRQRLEVE